jgi:hypothetical protein
LLGNNNWSESAITWNTLPAILPGAGNNNTLTSLGAFFWNATGSASSSWTLNPDSGLVNEINNGGEVTILGQPVAGSTVGYLFNTLANNPGSLNVTVAAAPEPSTMALLACGIGLIGGCVLRRNRNIMRDQSATLPAPAKSRLHK